MNTHRLLKTNTEIWLEYPTFNEEVKWYCWDHKRDVWVADIDVLFYMVRLRGLEFTHEYIKNRLVLQAAKIIGKLEFTLWTGKRLKLP